jgi:hypothetical protein
VIGGLSENGGRKKQHAGRECRGHSRSQDPRGRWVFFTFRDKTKLVHLSSLKEGVRVSSLKEGVRGAAWSHYATRSLLAALKPQLCYSLFHSGRRSDRSIGTRQLQSRAADAKRCGIEKHAEVRHIEDCDVDGTTVIHCNRVNEIAGREKLSCEPAPQLSKIYQDLRPRPRNTSNGRVTSDARLTVEHIKGHIFPVFVENTRTVTFPSGTFGIMFFIRANAGTLILH